MGIDWSQFINETYINPNGGCPTEKAKRAPVITPQRNTPVSNEQRLIQKPEDLPRVLEMKIKEPEWLVEDLILKAGYHIIAGQPGAMKSFFAQYLAGSFANGKDVLGHKTKARRVVYLDNENALSVVSQRYDILGITEDSNLHYWGMWCPEIPPHVPDDLYLDWAAHDEPVMFFDSLVRFHRGDENTASEMRDVSATFRSLSAEGATVIVLHHQGKPGLEDGKVADYRGSSEIEAGCDLGYSLKKTNGTTTPQKLELKCFKSRLGIEPQLDLTFDENNLFQTELSLADQQTQAVLEVMREHPGCTFNDITSADKVSYSRTKLRDLLKAGEGKQWRIEHGSHNTYMYHPMETEKETGGQ